MKEVAVVIPIYKEQPSEAELNSFKQCLTILRNHPIVLVIPNDFNLSSYELHFHPSVSLNTLEFDSSYFSSVKSYSKLLVSKRFYQPFKAFKNILIYQLDAWVFRDELLEWCALDMDYIGAPWLEVPPVSSGKKPLLAISSFLKNKVGNGGFSLRKVNSHLKWAWWTTFIFNLLPKNEDVIWSLMVPYKRPSIDKALKFSFEMNPEKSFKLTKQQLPFGCHAWEKYNSLFWSKFIPETTSLSNK